MPYVLIRSFFFWSHNVSCFIFFLHIIIVKLRGFQLIWSHTTRMGTWDLRPLICGPISYYQLIDPCLFSSHWKSTWVAMLMTKNPCPWEFSYLAELKKKKKSSCSQYLFVHAFVNGPWQGKFNENSNKVVITLG